MQNLIEHYRQQQIVFSEKRKIYARLTAIYRSTAKLYHQLRDVLWDQRPNFLNEETTNTLEARHKAQIQSEILKSEIIGLKLEAQDLYAQIHALQKQYQTWIDV